MGFQAIYLRLCLLIKPPLPPPPLEKKKKERKRKKFLKHSKYFNHFVHSWFMCGENQKDRGLCGQEARGNKSLTWLRPFYQFYSDFTTIGICLEIEFKS